MRFQLPATRLATRFAAAALLLLASLPVAVSAQEEERPIPFDSAGRMTAITPMLADRLALKAPAWPVTGAFREARLYAHGDARVLVVQRQDLTLVRFPLDVTASQELQAAIEHGMRIAGNPTGEPDVYQYHEVAGTRFAKRQLIYGALLYGPLLASFADDGNSGTALYLTGAAVPSLLGLGFARDGMLTRSQTDLGTDATLRWAALGSFGYRAVAGDHEGSAHAGTVLASSIVGTAAGLALGRNLTDGEAAGMIAGSNYTLAITSGLLGTTGAFEEKCGTVTYTGTNYDGTPWSTTSEDCHTDVSSAAWGGMLAAGLVGYPLGRAYARRSSYAVTAGDANALLVPAAMGVLAGVAIVGDGADTKATWGAVTGGLVVGLIAGDRFLVKPFDYTRSQATALRIGAVGGGLLGLALPAAANSDNGSVYAASALLGSIGGTVLAHKRGRPRRATSREVLREARLDGAGDRTNLASRVSDGTGVLDASTAATAREPRVQWQLDPAGLAMVAARAPGRHGILSITF